MAIPQLTEEQIRTWTREQKDRWWYETVYRGDMPQLTLRSAVTGFLIGLILSAVALYIGGKTGISIGVGLTSVVSAFAAFKLLHSLKLCSDFTILENNCTQSIATAAGYMIGPLISSMAAYMLVAQVVVPWWQILIWNSAVSLLGVLVAFPLKRRFINEEQMPFPEGRACGVVLDSLYTGEAAAGMFKAKLLGITTLLSGAYQFIVSDAWMKLVQFWRKVPWVLSDQLDEYYYRLAAKHPDLPIPKILGTDIRSLGLRVTLDAAMLGVGGLMGMRIATSVILGSVINFALVAPFIIRIGDIVPRIAADGTVQAISRSEIVNQWSLWWGITMMIVGSLVGLLAKPDILIGPFKRIFGKKDPAKTAPQADILGHIELPLWISFIGVPIMSLVVAALTHQFFSVPWHLALLALPLIFVLTVIGTNSMALTSWIPTGAMSKITQFTIGAIDRTNPATNLMTGGMTSEIASNAANLLSDIKPGYMLGAKPRQQAIGHIIGIVAGAIASTSVFFVIILDRNAPAGVVRFSDQFAMPAALQWKGVSELISAGLKNLHNSAIISMIVAAIAALAFEIARIVTRGRFPISAVSVGLGVVLPPESAFAMWVGAAFFWWQARRYKDPSTKKYQIWVEGCESICAGLISGAALVGIGNAVLHVILN